MQELTVTVSHRAAERIAYSFLGHAYIGLGQFNKAIEFHQENLDIAVELGGRAGEGAACEDLGCAFASLGQLDKSVELVQKSLVIAVEVDDPRSEGRAYGNMGSILRAILTKPSGTTRITGPLQ